MKTYAGSQLRNVAIVGHAHSGKTRLISALLRTAKMPAASSRFENGASITAYDEEELVRGMTMSNAVAFAEWHGIKVNLVDTPGSQMFVHEARVAMLPAETAVVVVNAQTGIESVTDIVWNFAAEVRRPRIVVINQVDHPRADTRTGGMAMLETMRERWGRQVVPVQLPIIDQHGFHGVIDLVTMQASFYTPEGDGRGTPGPIPHVLQSDANAAHEALIEVVAEGKDELMEEFFALGTLPQGRLVGAIHEAIREDRFFPVLYASGLRYVGTDHLLEFLKVYAPSPKERPAIAAQTLTRHSIVESELGTFAQAVMLRDNDPEPTALYIYKTMVDPIVGRISFFKVISGCVASGASIENYARGETERITHLAIMQGKQLIEVGELHGGDLGAAVKLRVTKTGDMLGAKDHGTLIEPWPIPEPAITYAVEPKSRADEEKLTPALHKLMEEDLLLCFYRDPQTKEYILGGSGQLHIDVIVSRLKRRFHTRVSLTSPKIL
jgi:elongation factor G